MERKKLYLKIILNLIIVVFTVFFIVVILPRLIQFFLPFVLGGVIAFLANPMVRFLERRVKIVRKTGSAIVIIGVIAAILGTIYGLGYLCITQIISFMNDVPKIGLQVEEQLLLIQEKYMTVYEKLPGIFQGMIDRLILGISQGVSNPSILGDGVPVFSSAGDLAKNVADVILMGVITLMSAYFFVAQRDEIAVLVKHHVPKEIVRSYRVISDNVKAAFSGYLKAQFKIMLILVVIMFLGFWFMHIEYAFLLAVLIAFLDFLPVLGTGTLLWPWAIIELISSNTARTICILVIYLVCQIVKQVLEPKMVGDSIGITPLETLFFMFLGYRLYGVMGMILGVPLGVLLIKVVRLGIFSNLIKGFRLLIEDTNELRRF